MIMNVNRNNHGKKTITTMLGLSAMLLVGTAGPLVTASYAGDREQPEPGAAFQALDQNKDGKLTAVEAKSHVELSRRWTEIDKDNSGAVDQAEFSAFEAMQEKEQGQQPQSK
jgi:hypothetical protein